MKPHNRTQGNSSRIWLLRRHALTLPPLAAVGWNIALLFVAYGLTRVAFLLENAENYAHLTSLSALAGIAHGALLFDASAIAYTNALYILLGLVIGLLISWWLTPWRWLST